MRRNLLFRVLDWITGRRKPRAPGADYIPAPHPNVITWVVPKDWHSVDLSVETSGGRGGGMSVGSATGGHPETAGASGTNYGCGGHTAGGPLPDPAYEALARQIAQDMGGEQPNEDAWNFMFPKASSGGTASMHMVDKMRWAYNLARAGYRKETESRSAHTDDI